VTSSPAVNGGILSLVKDRLGRDTLLSGCRVLRDMSEATPPKVLRTSLPQRALSRSELEQLEESESVTSVTPLGMYPASERVTHFGLARGPTESVLAWNPRTEYWERIASLEWLDEDVDWGTRSPDPKDIKLTFSSLQDEANEQQTFTPTVETPFEQLDEFLRHHLGVMYTELKPPLLLFDLFRALTD
jgi:hypothetical protein